MRKVIFISIVSFGVLCWGCEKMAAPAADDIGGGCTAAFPGSTVTYDNFVKTVIATYCTGGCHTGDASAPGDFRTYKGILPYISDFYFRVIQDRADMPQGNAPLPKAIRDSLNIWINNCAPEK
jgi:hypothetical protein